MFYYTGKTALITGASSGIGARFASDLAARKTNLILVARREEKLRAMAEELTQREGIKVEVISADLGKELSGQQLYEEVERRGLQVDILVNNAGFGTAGHFDEISPERENQEVMLNVAALVNMTHAFLPAMATHHDGAIINVASTAAFQPLPYMAVYGASKAFVLSFTLAIAEEFRSRGVRIQALCPGTTETSFFDSMESEEAKIGVVRTVEQVVATSLKALENNRSLVVDGQWNTLQTGLAQVLPLTVSAKISKQVMKVSH